ncbi:hypothetical protein DSL72_003183 [Monilinia vaccinii-corymbosi]|uniref:Integrase zinc-binding domain-containing protein n=1 Tax=Monilinia vaccinii-corymbosi TaxID=61207 RepID=A0A8A3NTA2_9HELO|nr:hypothetical protein DSL72_003183 [Monilinia vaccinii-corymbosi]
MYRFGKDNPFADALIRRVDELDAQNATKKKNRANRNTESLNATRLEALKGHKHLSLSDGLLLYNHKLVVPNDDDLRTLLIREAHDSVSTAYPGVWKTYLLLAEQYYWRGMFTFLHDTFRGLTPYEVLYGHHPKHTWDWKPETSASISNLNIQEACKFVERSYAAIAYAKEHILRAQEKMIRFANLHRRSIDFDIGDYVWLLMKEYPIQQSLQKFDFPVQGLFKIISRLNADKDLTWYPASDFKIALYKLRDFHLANPTRPGLSVLLPEWLRLYEQGEDNYDYMDNDRPMLDPDRTKFFLANQ